MFLWYVCWSFPVLRNRKKHNGQHFKMLSPEQPHGTALRRALLGSSLIWGEIWVCE